MSRQQWYRAEIEWAVMVEGKGLREWESAVYLYRAEDRDDAFRKALEFGRRDRDGHCHKEGRRGVERRLARVAGLDELGTQPEEVQVCLGTRPAAERLPFEHEFTPEEWVPMRVF